MNRRPSQHLRLLEESDLDQVADTVQLFRGDSAETSARNEVFKRAWAQIERKLKDHPTNERQILASRLLAAQEEERKSISASLNDGLCQSLFAIKLQLEGLLSADGETPSLLRSSLKSMVSAMEETIQEMQAIMTRLRPLILDDLGVIATISWLCSRFGTANSHIRIEKRVSINETDVPTALKTLIFRVLQESLNNIAEHSNAYRATVSLQGTREKTELAIEDNGRGFNSEDGFSVDSASGGLGLSIMREQVESSAGSLVVESTPGSGTILRALWQNFGVNPVNG